MSSVSESDTENLDDLESPSFSSNSEHGENENNVTYSIYNDNGIIDNKIIVPDSNTPNNESNTNEYQIINPQKQDFIDYEKQIIQLKHQNEILNSKLLIQKLKHENETLKTTLSRSLSENKNQTLSNKNQTLSNKNKDIDPSFLPLLNNNNNNAVSTQLKRPAGGARRQSIAQKLEEAVAGN